MPSYCRTRYSNAQVGPPHLFLAGLEAAFREDTQIILWHMVGPIKVDHQAIQDNQALKFHPMVLFVASKYVFLKNSGVICLAHTVDEQ